jgi:hypothetical protein
VHAARASDVATNVPVAEATDSGMFVSIAGERLTFPRDRADN